MENEKIRMKVGIRLNKENKSLRQQRTISKAIAYAGIGLHSGKAVEIRLLPAAIDYGIKFLRTDIAQAQPISAKVTNVTDTLRATTIANAVGTHVFTVEHLLAALAMLNIDNCLVEISSPEPPVSDGSAKVFLDLLEQAGIEEQVASVQEFCLPEVVAVYDADKYICALPYDGFRISFTSINNHPLLGTQHYDLVVSEAACKTEIAPARTIGFMHEVEMLKKMGLGLGGSLENVVVYDEKSVLTPLRFEDELVRHKILDVIGDLSLVGKIKAHIIAVKSSHALNIQLAKKINELKNLEGK